jgi:hypothetical protein
MNPIKAFDNTLKYPVKAILAKLFGRRVKSLRSIDKDFTVKIWRGVEYLIEIKDKNITSKHSEIHFQEPTDARRKNRQFPHDCR